MSLMVTKCEFLSAPRTTMPPAASAVSPGMWLTASFFVSVTLRIVPRCTDPTAGDPIKSSNPPAVATRSNASVSAMLPAKCDSDTRSPVLELGTSNRAGPVPTHRVCPRVASTLNLPLTSLRSQRHPDVGSTDHVAEDATRVETAGWLTTHAVCSSENSSVAPDDDAYDARRLTARAVRKNVPLNFGKSGCSNATVLQLCIATHDRVYTGWRPSDGGCTCDHRVTFSADAARSLEISTASLTLKSPLSDSRATIY
mmetsp:Transcript_10472/g.32501  ORF Transcript_10472/g.32501 Transcript_10472/m.32501 type:complete len:255 (-) Transcript_10472:1916-2680(-)